MMSRSSYGFASVAPAVWPVILMVILLPILIIVVVSVESSSTYERGRKLECAEVQEWVTCPVAFGESSGELYYENKWFRQDQLGTVKSIKDGFFDTKIVTVQYGKNRFSIQIGKGNLEKTLDLFKDKGNK